jgi:hypothetical protein
MLPSQQELPKPRRVGTVRSLTRVNLLPLNGCQKPGWKNRSELSTFSGAFAHPAPVKKYLPVEVRKMWGYRGNSQLPGRGS